MQYSMNLTRYEVLLGVSFVIMVLVLSFNTNYHFVKAKIETGDILNGAVTNPKIANNAINSSQLQNNAVSTDKLQSLSVTNPKIQSQAVTGSNIATNTITSSNLADNAVGETRVIGQGIITGDKLSHEAVTPSKTSFLQFGIFKPGENGWNPDNHTSTFNIITFNKTDTSGDRQLEARSQSVVTVNVLEPTRCHIDNNASDNFGSTCVKDFGNPNLGDQTFKSTALGVACFATDKNDEPLGADPTQIIIKCDPDVGYGAPITNSILEIAILNPGEP